VRDLSLLVSSDVAAVNVQEEVLKHRLVTNVTLFDVYEGDRLPEGQRSLAFHVYFQSPKRTLTAEEVTRALDSIVGALQKQFGAQLRSDTSSV
jgi:phenylalanyl-tRNA synthetase beta chain